MEPLSTAYSWQEVEAVEQVESEGRKRIAIVGGSGSGLVCARELVAAGIHANDITIFEKSGDVGGVFSSSYSDLQMTSSSNLSAFGSFPPALGLIAKPKYWTCQEYHIYLSDFARHFGLTKMIEFHTEIISVKEVCHPNAESKTLLAVTAMSSSEGRQTTKSYVFHHVVVCSGTVRNGFEPRLHQMRDQTLLSDYESKFEGEVVHSVAYQGNEPFRGKRVLVVGAGETGSDVSLQVAKVATATCLSVRRGPGSLIPRVVYGNPSDIDSSRVYHAVSRHVYEAWGGLVHRAKLVLDDWQLQPEDDLKVLKRAAEVNRETHKRLRPKSLSTSGSYLTDYCHPLSRFGTKNLSMIDAMVNHGMAYNNSDIARFAKVSVSECAIQSFAQFKQLLAVVCHLFPFGLYIYL
jgi:dimethylaniline monooxygenase (N-oxide forming)